MSFFHRIDVLLMFAGWSDNPVSRKIERAYWRSLEADMAVFRAGRML